MRAVPTSGIAALVLAAGLGLAACSSGSPGSVASPATGSSGTAGGCGTIPTTLPSDPGGVLSGLPASVSALYNGYPTPVYKSAFATWKPRSPGDKTVGFLLSETNNGYQLALEQILAGMLKG